MRSDRAPLATNRELEDGGHRGEPEGQEGGEEGQEGRQEEEVGGRMAEQ